MVLPMNAQKNTTQKGQTAESIAIHYLKKNNFTILQRNIHTAYGEIDILAKKGNEFICVEVRSRYSKKSLPPEMSLSTQKYRRLILSVLSLPWLHNRPVRIDFITVLQDSVERHYRDVRWDSLSPGKKLAYSF